MFQIFIFVIYLDNQISFLDFSVFWIQLITLRNMFCSTLQDLFWYFLHRTGYGSGSLVWFVMYFVFDTFQYCFLKCFRVFIESFQSFLSHYMSRVALDWIWITQSKRGEKKRNGRFSEHSSRSQMKQLLWRLRFLRTFSIFKDFYLGILLFPSESPQTCKYIVFYYFHQGATF